MRKHNFSIRQQLVERMLQLATASLGLVAALAWNDAVQSLFARFYATGEGLGAKFLYALVVTLVIVVVTYYVTRFIHYWIGQNND